MFYQAELHKQAREAEQPATPSSNGVLIDLARREVFLDGEQLMLTFKEFELLAHLVENSTRTVGRDELLESLWSAGDEHPHERTIDVHIRRLRSKLGRLSGTVRTVRGQGYRFFEHPKLWCGPPPNTPSSLFTLETPRSFLRVRGFHMPFSWRAITR